MTTYLHGSPLLIDRPAIFLSEIYHCNLIQIKHLGKKASGSESIELHQSQHPEVLYYTISRQSAAHKVQTFGADTRIFWEKWGCPSNLMKSPSSITCRSCPIVLKFCTEHGSDTAVLSAKFQVDWII